MYVGEGAAYVPVPSLKNRPLSPNLQALQTLQGLQGLTGGGGGTGIAGDEDWRRHPESWDREHRRYRPNTTRVQRKHCTYNARNLLPTFGFVDPTGSASNLCLCQRCRTVYYQHSNALATKLTDTFTITALISKSLPPQGAIRKHFKINTRKMIL